jgi:hypothetical protein
MLLEMKKIKESNEYVWYSFETGVWTGKKYQNKKGRLRNEIIIKYGVFRFDKINPIGESSIKMMPENTDPFFLNDPRYMFACLVKMKSCKEANYFDDIVTYAAG